MKQDYNKGNVRACCPDCGGAVTTFELKAGTHEWGSVIQDISHVYEGKTFGRTIYVLLRCAGCGRAGLAKVHCNESITTGVLESFLPVSIERLAIPAGTPVDIITEFQEAETCAAYGCNRAASALFRSTLEKVLKANGYTEGSLQKKIDDAETDGIISAPRKRRAQDDIRVLGNDVLHDAWRTISDEEVKAAHRYLQRILEDFYDDRETVEKILSTKPKK